MTHKLSSKMVEALKLLTANPSGMTLQQLNQAGIKRTTLNALRKQQPPLVVIERKLYKVTSAAQAPVVPRYILQQWSEGTWYSVFSHVGEPLRFDTQTQAETRARLLSITSDDIRVILEGSDPDAFTVYRFGKRYVQHRGGTVVEHPAFDVDQDEGDEEATVMFVIQRRSAEDWELAEDRRWADYELASQAAIRYSTDQPKSDFRVTFDGLPQLAPFIYREGQSQLDMTIFELLSDEQIANLYKTIEAIITERTL